MRKSSLNESQRVAIIAEQDTGKKVEDICRQHQISPATFYKWNRTADAAGLVRSVE